VLLLYVRPRHPFLVSFVSAMSKRNASAASAAAFDAADDKVTYDGNDIGNASFKKVYPK